MAAVISVRLKDSFDRFFDSWTRQVAEDFVKRGKVRTLSMNSNSLNGLVSGAHGIRYEAEILLSPNRDEIIGTDCSCPDGSDCKHCAAIALSFLQGRQYVKTVKQEHSQQDTIKQMTIYEGASRNSDLSFHGRATQEKLSTNLLKQADSRNLAKTHREQGYVAPVSLKTKNLLEKIALAYCEDEHADSNQKQQKAKLVYVLAEHGDRGAAIINLEKINILKDGSPGYRQLVHINPLHAYPLPHYLQPSDISALSLWSSLGDLEPPYYDHRSNEYRREESLLATTPELSDLVISRILATGRLHWKSPESPPLAEGQTLPGAFAWYRQGEFLHLQRSATDEHGKQHSCPHWNTSWYLDQEKMLYGKITPVIPHKVLDAIAKIQKVPVSQALSLSAAIVELGLQKHIPLPIGNDQFELRLISPTPVLKIERIRCQQSYSSPSGLNFKSGEVATVAICSKEFERNVRNVFLDESGKLIKEKHDHSRDEYFLQSLEEQNFEKLPDDLFGKGSTKVKYFTQTTANKWLDFSSTGALNLTAKGWRINQSSLAQIEAVDLIESDLTVEIDDQDSWWFSLTMKLDVGGKQVALLPILISALKSLPENGSISSQSIESLNHNGKFVATLASGTFITFPFERIRSILLSLQELLGKDSASDAGSSVKASLLHVQELLNDTAFSASRWVGADKIRDLAARIKQLGSLSIVEPPPDLKASLRHYQLEGLSWLQFMGRQKFGGILADDMGLGKTIQLLAHILQQKKSGDQSKPFLVVCPTSVIPNWIAEAKKFAPDLRVLPLVGADRFEQFAHVANSDLVLTTYPLIQRDHERFTKIKWHGIALDEAQAVKNPKTQAALALAKLKADQRFCLTGTPIENHLGDLWSYFNFLIPGLLGDQKTFNTLIKNPIEREGNLALRNQLAKRIRPFLLRRTKGEVAIELPSKTTIIKPVELIGNQRDLYETVRLASTKRVREEVAKKGFKSSQIIILDALLKLRQVCCDPRLVKLSAAESVQESAKFEVLMDMLKELHEERRKILLFSSFTSMLDLIAAELKKLNFPYVELTGSTKDRAAPVREFQEKETQIFLISLKAGGTGLNLTAADTVIHYDPWWNPAVEDQATDRAHRIGQTKSVFVYKLIVQGTIEQRMLELQERKRLLADSIFDENGNANLSFSEDDLESLLKPIDELC
jgi:SNF2 family DNA or RNA helicase